MTSLDITGCYLKNGLQGAGVEVRRPVGEAAVVNPAEDSLDLEGSDWEAEPMGFPDISGAQQGRRTRTPWPGRLWPLLRGDPETLLCKGGDLWEGVGSCGADTT